MENWSSLRPTNEQLRFRTFLHGSKPSPSTCYFFVCASKPLRLANLSQYKLLRIQTAKNPQDDHCNSTIQPFAKIWQPQTSGIGPKWTMTSTIFMHLSQTTPPPPPVHTRPRNHQLQAVRATTPTHPSSTILGMMSYVVGPLAVVDFVTHIMSLPVYVRSQTVPIAYSIQK